MKVRFWGVRGSIATPMTNAALNARLKAAVRLAVRSEVREDEAGEFVKRLPWYIRKTVGGDTPCIEIWAGGNLLVLDAGTGFRALGHDLIRRSEGSPIVAHILISHTHWDHISGIPFFTPAFNKNNRLIVYGPNPALEEAVKNQQAFEYFPVPLAPAFEFVQIDDLKPFSIGEVQIEAFPVNHPGGCHAYRITHDGKSIVYATDSEYKDLSVEGLKPYVDFFADADLLIFDAQYTMVENIEKEDWGHSNVFAGIDMAVEARVKTLVITHHDPVYDDRTLWEILRRAKEYLELNDPPKQLEIFIAYEGLRMVL